MLIVCLLPALTACYSAWRLGGWETGVQWQLAISVGVAIALGLIFRSPRDLMQSTQVVLSLLVLSWIIFGAIQWIPLPQAMINLVGRGVEQTREVFVSESLPSGIFPRVEGAPMVLSIDSLNTFSVSAGLSQKAWSVHVLGVASFIFGGCFFYSDLARRFLLVSVAMNAGGIAIWGILQRCTGSRQVLPWTYTESSYSSFSTFRYENAGAAYVLLGMAATIGLIVWVLGAKRLWTFSKVDRSCKTFAYNRSGYWTDLTVVASITLLIVLCAAVLLAGSRVGWIAGTIALLMVGTASLRFLGRKVVLVVMVLGVSLILSVILLFQQTDRLTARVEQLSVVSIATDDRLVHWQAGLATARHYFPVGSGIGTYGYSHLPFQTRDIRVWYSYAHNQFLEALTENGLVAVLILIFGASLLFRHSWRLFFVGEDPVQSALGAVGMIVLTCVLCQATVDFTILYPSNMMTAALLLGCLSGCEIRPAVNRFHAVSAPRWYSRPSVWLFAIMIPVLSSQHFLGREVIIERQLDRTKLPDGDSIPTLDQCERNLNILRTAAEKFPRNAGVLQRLSWWELAEMRIGRVKSNRKSLRNKQWLLQSPMNWFAEFHALPADQRDQYRASLLLKAADSQSINRAYLAMHNSVVANPLVPQIHLSLAELAPFVGDDWRIHAERSRRLSTSSPEHLYANGLLCLAAGEKNEALALWNRYLAMNSARRDTILKLALANWNTRIIIERLFPADPKLLLTMSSRAVVDPILVGTGKAWQARCEEVIKTADIPMVERVSSLGKLSEIRGDWKSAIEYWEQAIRFDPGEPSNRIRLAKCLLRVGDDVAANDQAIAAKYLEGATNELDQLFTLIEESRKRMRAKTK